MNSPLMVTEISQQVKDGQKWKIRALNSQVTYRRDIGNVLTEMDERQAKVRVGEKERERERERGRG